MLLFLLACDPPEAAARPGVPAPAAAPVDNPYLSMRQLALSMTPGEGGAPPGEGGVYAVVTDWGSAAGSVTIVATRGGDASMYYSGGGGTIGLGGKAPVRAAAQALCAVAAGLESAATPTADTTTLSQPGRFRALLLTPSGVRALEGNPEALTPGSPEERLFNQVNLLVTSIRAASPE
ncbi:MAG: hypothetical protein V4850_20575 [Myxococcota bacterium]